MEERRRELRERRSDGVDEGLSGQLWWRWHQQSFRGGRSLRGVPWRKWQGLREVGGRGLRLWGEGQGSEEDISVGRSGGPKPPLSFDLQ